MAAQTPRAGPPEGFAEFAPSQPSPGQQAPSSYSQQQPPDTLFSGPGRRHVTHSPDRQTDRQSGSDLQREIASPRDQHIYVPVRWISPHYQCLVRVSGASPRTTVDMRQRVGVRRGVRSTSSDPSTTDMARLRDRSAASTTARMALDVITADILRWRQDDPQAQPQGNETTPSRFGCGTHLP